jgi:F-type H+-transporting ATPase subunit delta
MIEIKLGDRYARSIYGMAEERGELERVHEDFQLIEQVCNQNPDFVNMLRSPLIAADTKQAILNRIFSGKLATATSTLIEIMVRKGRERYLRDVAMRFNDLYDNQHNVTRGVITSAAPLTQEQKDRIRQVVEGQLKTSFVMEEKVDPSLIGGFKLRVGDYLLDGSVSSTLRKLYQEFDKNPYIKLQ